MKKLSSLFLLLFPLFAMALSPVTITITNSLLDSVNDDLTAQTLYRGDTYIFTNCLALSGTATKDLAGCTVTVTVGDGVAASQIATGTVNNTTGGLWSAVVTLRTNEAAAAFFQTRITDGTNSVTYPLKMDTTKAKL